MEQYNERYEVIRKLGSGATATVSLVWDTLLLRKVAVKAGTRKRILRQEARNLAAFWTPYFPILYDYAEVGGKKPFVLRIHRRGKPDGAVCADRQVYGG